MLDGVVHRVKPGVRGCVLEKVGVDHPVGHGRREFVEFVFVLGDVFVLFAFLECLCTDHHIRQAGHVDIDVLEAVGQGRRVLEGDGDAHVRLDCIRFPVHGREEGILCGKDIFFH